MFQDIFSQSIRRKYKSRLHPQLSLGLFSSLSKHFATHINSVEEDHLFLLMASHPAFGVEEENFVLAPPNISSSGWQLAHWVPQTLCGKNL